MKEKDTDLKAQVMSTMKKVNQQKREFAKVRQYYESLKKKSNDPKACKQIGIFYCVEKGDWGKGLQLLSKAGEPALRSTILFEFKRPTTSTEQVQLADTWWKLAAKEKGKVRKAYQLRGRYWYLKARPGLPRNKRIEREKKLQYIALEADKIMIWNQHNGVNLDRGTVECLVTLLFKGKSAWRQVVRLPWNPDSPAGVALHPGHVRFDQVRIDITKFRGNGGGLAEIEVFDGNINLAQNASVVAMSYYRNDRRFYPENVIDGNKTGDSGFWLLGNGQKGWVMIDMVNYLQQP